MKPGLLKVDLRDAYYRSREREFQTLRFLSDEKMLSELEATSWVLSEHIWVRNLASTYKLERVERLRMLEEQEA